MPENILDRVDAALDRAAALDRYLRRIHTEDPTEPHSDRQSTGPLHRLDMGRTAKIVYGRVVDAVAYCHWYKVQPEGAKATIPCCMLSGTALTPFGVREHNQLHPNAGVYLLLYPSSPYGVIIGVEPKHQFDGTKSLSDYVSLCSAHSIQTEQVHSFPFTLPKNGTVVDWSSGRPADGTCAGEWGMFAESGVAVFIDSAMAFLRADEQTGVWAFYRDQLLRLSGHNLQIRATGGWEVEALDDQGEFNHAEGFTPYPWEQLGAFALGATVHRERDPGAQQVTEPHYAKYEPLFDDQQPFHRTRHYHGYAGQGGKRQVVAPPVGAAGVNRYSTLARYVGLFDETVSQAGAWTVRSATGIRLVKRGLVPAAKAVRRPEDATGDTDANYRAAGAQGDGPAHAVGTLAAAGPDPHLTKALGALDGQTYAVNWEGQLGFRYHTRDYYLPEESELRADLGPGQARLPFAALADEHYLPQPQPARVRVDHRYQSVPVYPTISYVDLSDDGGVLIGDGYGSELRMVGGHMDMAPAGDLVLRPGRNLVVMGGRDVLVRARNHLELSTTERDVRIHSGRNMEVAAERGVLVESKSETLGWSGWRDNVGDNVFQEGVHIKGARSGVCVWADLMYLRTGIDGPGTGFYLDAGKGDGNVSVNCAAMQTWARSAVAHYLGGGTAVEAAYTYTAGGALIGGDVYQVGSLTSTGTILADGWLLSASGHVGTALADSYENKVPAVKDQPLAQAQQSVADGKEAHKVAVNNARAGYTTTWDEGLYTEGLCGDDQTVAEIRFSFRTAQQYRTSDFRLYEARWQQLARIWGTGTALWAERPVEKSGEATYPYPGKAKLVDEPALYEQDLALFDLDTGAARDRTDPAYEAGRYEAPRPVTLNTNYRVVN